MFFFVIFILQLLTEFVIGIDISKCPPLRLPTNGYVVCDHLIGAFCAPVCNPGFVYEAQPAQAYVCNPLRRAWATYPGGYPLPWPNCIRSTTQTGSTAPGIVKSDATKSATAIKKSIVDQQVTAPSTRQESNNGKESLWQRMLALTSQLTQSKMREEAVGNARSLQTQTNSMSSSNNNMDNSNSMSVNSASNPAALNYYERNDAPVLSEEQRQVEFRRLQQYWDEYYKRYYASIGKGTLPDWMTRSPWSNDPERVQGALDTDMYNMGASPENRTTSQNMNNYYQQFPRPGANSTTDELDNTTSQRPNSSSDTFIESVIENDLASKNMLDKSLTKDLFYEDQLIHNEERKRPRLMTTTPPTTATKTTTLKPTSTSTTSSTPPYSYSTRNSSQYDYPYNPNTNGATTQNGNAQRNSSGIANTTKNAYSSTPDYSIALQINRTASPNHDSKDSVNTAAGKNDAAANDPYEKYKQYYKDYYSKIQNGSAVGGEGQQNASSGSTASSQSGSNISDGIGASPGDVNSSFQKLQALKHPNLSKLLNPTSKDDVKEQDEAYGTGEELEDDDTDYLDQLDITALVKELIKLETIRKEKKLLRRKHLQQEHSKEAANYLAGNLVRGYFKTRKAPPQKGLKKHLLHKGRHLLKSKSNQSPLPKFNR